MSHLVLTSVDICVMETFKRVGREIEKIRM